MSEQYIPLNTINQDQWFSEVRVLYKFSNKSFNENININGYIVKILFERMGIKNYCTVLHRF